MKIKNLEKQDPHLKEIKIDAKCPKCGANLYKEEGWMFCLTPKCNFRDLCLTPVIIVEGKIHFL